MAAVGVPFHAITTTAAAAAASSLACEFPAQSHGSSSSASSTLLDDSPAFDLSDFIMSDQASDFAPSSGFPAVVAHEYQSPMAPPPMNMIDEGGRGDCFGDFCNDGDINSTISRGSGAELGGRRRDGASRIAFRMKSQVEIVDDGFKWRKYGKKSVKNSPNPRNYYRCSTEGCSVKKRVERDREDPSYVITTYEGIHTHMSPGVVYYASRDAVSGRYFVAGCQMPSAAAAAPFS